MRDINLRERGFLLWIGMGILACLVLLTVISFLDFRTDSQHTPSGAYAAAVCHVCGTQSIPQCLRCGSIMQWDPAQAMHRCPRCQRTSRVSCPSCGLAMIHAQQAAPQRAAPRQTAPQQLARRARPVAAPNYSICPQCSRRTAQPGAW